MKRREFFNRVAGLTITAGAFELSDESALTGGKVFSKEKNDEKASGAEKKESATKETGKNSSVKICSAEPVLKTRGVILHSQDLASSLPWPKLAKEAGLTTIATHFGPQDVIPFLQSERGRQFLRECEENGLQTEHELHAMSYLLPRDLFKKDPSMFRMNEKGERTPDCNCCAHSSEALSIIAENAVKAARIARSTTHRYFYWLDDGRDGCHCPRCRELSVSDQALLIENAIIKALRSEISPQASLAHLAYAKTFKPPKQIKPDPGIFLEFAPINRSWTVPLSDGKGGVPGQPNHKSQLTALDQNLKIFPAETAQVLEYWLDVSLFSRWKKPAVKLPWHPEVCRKDVQTYRDRGIRNITSFAVYIDDAYQKRYGDLSFIKDYGKILCSAR